MLRFDIWASASVFKINVISGKNFEQNLILR